MLCASIRIREIVLARDVPRVIVIFLGGLVQRLKPTIYRTWSFEAEYEPVTNAVKTVNSRNLNSIINPTRGHLGTRL